MFQTMFFLVLMSLFQSLSLTSIIKGQVLQIYIDRKSAAYYLVCHLYAEKLMRFADLEASLDGTNEDEIYKLGLTQVSFE